MTYERPLQAIAAQQWCNVQAQMHSRQSSSSAECRATCFDQVFAQNNLLRVGFHIAEKGGQACGVDHIALRDLTPVELGQACGFLEGMLRAGEYVADVARQLSIPKPGKLEYRLIQVPTGVDRIVGRTLVEVMQPWMERLFLQQSHGFRPGRSNVTLLASLVRSIRRDKRYFVATDDIRKAFDNLPVAVVLEAHRKAFQDRSLFEWPPADDKRFLDVIAQVLTAGKPKRKRGILQGCPYSPIAMNVFLHFFYDVPIAKSFSGSWYRYADNLICAGQSPVEGNEFLSRSAEHLAIYGIQLKGDLGRTVDLADTSVNVMGFVLSREGDQLSIGLAETSWAALELGLVEAHRCPNPPRQAQAVVRGWIQAYGPAFEPAESIPAHVLFLTERQGFPRVLVLEEVKRWVEKSAAGWRKILQKEIDA